MAACHTLFQFVPHSSLSIWDFLVCCVYSVAKIHLGCIKTAKAAAVFARCGWLVVTLSENGETLCHLSASVHFKLKKTACHRFRDSRTTCFREHSPTVDKVAGSVSSCRSFMMAKCDNAALSCFL